MPSAGCVVGAGMWLAQSQDSEAFIRATQREAICRMYLFCSYLSSLNKNMTLWEYLFYPIASLHQSYHFLMNYFRKLYMVNGCLLNSSPIIAACLLWNPSLFVCKFSCSSVQRILLNHSFFLFLFAFLAPFLSRWRNTGTSGLIKANPVPAELRGC